MERREFRRNIAGAAAEMGLRHEYEAANPSGGFYGTVNAVRPELAGWAISNAIREVARAAGADELEARAFLDGNYGRHFADRFLDNLRCGSQPSEALDNAIRDWATRRCPLEARLEWGVPYGASFLEAVVLAAAA